ncbi:MAG: hypothetical protein AAF824_09030 [Bacteroidota bacterium]
MKAYCLYTPLIFISLLLGTVHSFSQRIVNEQVFPVKGYHVEEIGYPSKIIQADRGRFLFVEYWAQGEGAGEQKREMENYYLQCYGTRSFVEHWFKPVTEPGHETMQVTDLISLSNGSFVVGDQFVSRLDMVCTVGRFFFFDGTSKTEEPIIISNLGKKDKKKKYKEYIRTSPDKKRMLWVGMGNNFDVFSTIWAGNSDSISSNTFQLPIQDKRYTISDIKIDDSSSVYFLAVPNRTAMATREARIVPLLIKYDYVSNSCETKTLEMPGAEILNANMQLTPINQLIITGITTRPDAEQWLQNGKMLKPAHVQRWSHVFMKRIRTTDFQENVSTEEPIPTKIIKYFSDKESNFSSFDLILNRDDGVFLFEEHYFNKGKNYLYEIGAVGINVKEGKVQWGEVIKKRQRDKYGDNFLSYVSGISRNRLRLIYLSEKGARGKVLCTSLDLKTGVRRDKMLASNEEAKYLFFTKRSEMVSAVDMVFLGMGNPGQNDFKLFTVTF